MKVEANRQPTDLLNHKGEECLYILSGEIKFLYGKITHILQEGDWAYFKGTIPHRIFGNGKVDAEVIGIITSKDHLYHGSLSHTFNLDKNNQTPEPSHTVSIRNTK
ncbi:MAG: cupin domain-containing protein [Candidatus Brocadiales bacterium]|nr:cupin domain-containing protein [Candidatus Brocadiales bacterium]